eukprot:5231390-Pleurochrysis_carterae.AAC.8
MTRTAAPTSRTLTPFRLMMVLFVSAIHLGSCYVPASQPYVSSLSNLQMHRSQRTADRVSCKISAGAAAESTARGADNVLATSDAWTQALERSSPPGLHEAYTALRRYRLSKPLLYLRQFSAACPKEAAALCSWVDFSVPRTVREAVNCFCSQQTTQFIGAVLVLTFISRLALGPFRLADSLAAGLTAVAWCFQEWLIHDKLLHSPWNWFGRTVHRWHHELPYYHVCVDQVQIAAPWFAVAATLAVTAGLATAHLAPFLSALATYSACGGVYEACHFLAHTPVRPLPRELGRMRAHHMKHHLINDEYWLAFTVPGIDTLLGTSPSTKSPLRSRR